MDQNTGTEAIALTASILNLENQVEEQKGNISSALLDMNATLEDLFGHLENMAAHIVALESVVKELVRSANLDHQAIQDRIESKLAHVSGSASNALGAMNDLLAP